MRFPTDTVPNEVAPVDATEVGPSAGVGAARRLSEGERGVAAPLPGLVQNDDESKRAYYERAENDRRKMCRRIYHLPVLLDTRSGEERRKANRRRGDPLTHITKAV